MYEGPFDSAENDGRPIYVADTRKDGGPREDWKEAAEYIAHIEGGIALSRRKDSPMTRGLASPMTNSNRASSWWAGASLLAPSLRQRRASSSTAKRSWPGRTLSGRIPRLCDALTRLSWAAGTVRAEFAGQLMGELAPLSADASDEDQQFHMLLLASELADELQRRGVICAVPNPTAGVWVFRTPRSTRRPRLQRARKGVTMNERQPHDDKNDAQLPENECDIAPEREERAAHPRIYVASLADYNDGRLHGAWIDAAQDVQALQRCIQNMLDASPSPGAEEWAIHDYEGFEFVQLSEFESIETVSRPRSASPNMGALSQRGPRMLASTHQTSTSLATPTWATGRARGVRRGDARRPGVSGGVQQGPPRAPRSIHHFRLRRLRRRSRLQRRHRHRRGLGRQHLRLLVLTGNPVVELSTNDASAHRLW